MRFARGDQTPFRGLSEEWIRRYFVLGAKDTAALDDPQNAKIAQNKETDEQDTDRARSGWLRRRPDPSNGKQRGGCDGASVRRWFQQRRHKNVPGGLRPSDIDCR